MKQTVKITLCGILAALSAVFMLLSYFPYLTYAVPAVAGLFIMVAVIEAGYKWALGAYAAASVLVFLFAEPEGKLLYICFFGYYPILKAVFDRRKSRIVEWFLKLAVFNAAIIAVYAVFARLFGVSLEEFGSSVNTASIFFCCSAMLCLCFTILPFRARQRFICICCTRGCREF